MSGDEPIGPFGPQVPCSLQFVWLPRGPEETDSTFLWDLGCRVSGLADTLAWRAIGGGAAPQVRSGFIVHLIVPWYLRNDLELYVR